jgi:GxxExxY protein
VDIEAAAKQVVDCAFKVHTVLGPGLLETAYEACLAYELTLRNVSVRRQVAMPLRYDGVELEVGYRLDVLADGQIVIEVKSCEKLLPIHFAQLVSYLKLGKYKLGFLLNFNSLHMQQGIRRVVNGL